MSHLEIIGICLLSFVTATLSGVTGTGGGAIFLAGLNLPLNTAIPIHGVVQFFSNVHRVYLLKDSLRKEVCIPFVLGCALGLLIVANFIKSFDNKILPYVLIISILLYTLFKPKRFPVIKLKKTGYFFLGLATGFLGVLIGVVGPLIAPFFFRDDYTSTEIVANKSFVQSTIHLSKIPVFIYLGFPFMDYLLPLVLFILTGLLGTYVGVSLLQKISPKTFMKILKTFLFLVTIKMSYTLYLLL